MSSIPLQVVTAPPIFGPPAPAEPVAEGRFGFVKPEHSEFPPILIIAVTNLCDMACIHCAHPVIKKLPDYKGTFMPPEVHTRIVEETKQFKDQLFVFRYAADGESLLHPKFIDFVEQAKAAGIGPIDLTTNAMTLTEEKMRRLLQAPIDVIDVSLDGFSKETYEKIRLRGKFDVVTANARRLSEMRRELGSPTKLMVSIIEQKEALAEIEAFKAYWSEYVDEVLVRPLNDDLGLVQASEFYHEPDVKRWPCPQFWKRVTITWNGNVRFCVEDWRNHGVVGNIMEQSIQDIWKGPLYEKFREAHATGRWGDMTMCAPCRDWQHMKWDHGFEKAVNKILNRP